MHFIGRVTLFFANNSLVECRITIVTDPEVIISSHTMFINAFTKEFIRLNNAIPSYDIPFKHLLYYKMVANVYWNIENVFKNTKTYSISICQSFFFHANFKFSQ